MKYPNRHPFKSWRRLTTIALALGMATLVACGGERQTENIEDQEQIEDSLTFNNITLEQAGDDGDTVWKIFAQQAIYAENEGYARVQQPEGELFRDGEAIYAITGDRGDVFENGDRILLRGNVEARDLRNDALLQGEFLEWKPEEGVLLVRDNLRGTHPQVEATANEGRLYDEEQRLELSGSVIAITTDDPQMAMQTEALTWLMPEQRLVSTRPTQIQRQQQGQVTDIALARAAELNLEANRVFLRQEAQLALSDPGVRVNGTELVWDLIPDQVRSSNPLTIIQPLQRVVVTANSGIMNVRSRIVNLQGDVQLVAQLNGSVLQSDRLNWNIRNQQLRANGNVNYQQVDPPMTARGPQALGRLENQTLVMTGGRIVSEFVPE